MLQVVQQSATSRTLRSNRLTCERYPAYNRGQERLGGRGEVIEH